jgi:hypothetical protein
VSAAAQAYAELVEQGCLCGTDRVANCQIHGRDDLRGLAAYLRAGSPRGFPLDVTCALCGAPSLMYPSVALDRGEIPADAAPPPTTVCPRCSHPAAERALRREAVAYGYDLNDKMVFT